MPYRRFYNASNIKIATVLLAVWHLCVLCFLASTAVTQWPGLHHDSALYTTPIIKSAALGIWEFDSYLPLLVNLESSSFNLHGQLYQFVFAKVLRISDYESLFRWTAALNVAAYIVYLLLGRKIFCSRFPRLGIWIASGMAAVTALACIYLQGRPEYLLPLLTIVPFVMREWHVTAPFAKPAAYVLIGLTFILSPITGVLCLMGITAWIALRRGNKIFREIILYGCLSFSIALIFLIVICPVNPWQWLLNTIAVGSSATGAFDSISDFSMGQFGYPALLELPFWNVFSLGVFGVVALALVRHRLWWLALVYVAALLLILMPKTNIYSYLGFMPVIMLALLGREEKLLLLPAKLERLPVVLVSSFAFFGAIGLFRAMLLAVLFSSEGVSFEQTRASVRQLESTLNNIHDKIGFVWLSRPSFVAFSTAEKFLVTITVNGQENDKDPLFDAYETKFHSKVRYILLPQLGHLAEPPSTLNEGMFVLETNGWSKRRATFFGLKLGGAMPGYQFALYRRNEHHATVSP